MPDKHILKLYENGQLIAKTIDRIEVLPDVITVTPWKNEAKLLRSKAGSCLSSGTLLIPNVAIPTYGHNGRCYGFLFDATNCVIYEASPTDANTNRDYKLKMREEAYRKRLINSPEAISAELQSLKTLSTQIFSDQSNQMNEILLDAWTSSCAGLFIRNVNIASANPQSLKLYFQSLIEIRLIQKYLLQSFELNLSILIYDERQGTLLDFPSDQEILSYAKIYGVTKTYPKLFEMLHDTFRFKSINSPPTVAEKLEEYGYRNTDLKDFLLYIQSKYIPFNNDSLTAEQMLNVEVDATTGIDETLFDEAVTKFLASPTNPNLNL